MRNIAQALMVVTACLSASQVFAQVAPSPSGTTGVSAEQLERDLETMKKQVEEMQEKIRKQEELLKQLTIQPPPPPPVAKPSPELEEQIRQKVRDDIMREIQPSLSAAKRAFP
jgi:predicted RNA-binding protein with PIN domain